MRLDIADLGASSLSQTLQSANLIDHIGHQIGAGHIHIAATKTGQIAISHMGADDDIACLGRLERGQNACCIAGMKAAGHIGAADDVEHGGIVAHAPCAKALSQVAVQIHFHFYLLAAINAAGLRFHASLVEQSSPCEWLCVCLAPGSPAPCWPCRGAAPPAAAARVCE